MEKGKCYNISAQNFTKLRQWSSNIYNTAVVLDYFCLTQTQYAELNNITPIIQILCKDADCLYAYFINLKYEIKL